MSIVTNDPFEVARRIHGEGSSVGARGKRAFIALTRTTRGRIGLALLVVFLIMAVFGPATARSTSSRRCPSTVSLATRYDVSWISMPGCIVPMR